MSATPAEVEAAQKAMGDHWVDWVDCTATRGWICTCGSFFGRDVDGNRNEHKARAVADAVLAAAQARIAALALDKAASDVAGALANEVGGHTSTYSVRRWLRARADEIEAQS